MDDLVGMIARRAIGLPDRDTWDPVVPPDLHLAKLPPVAEDGTVECWACRKRVQFSDANIANQSYICSPCTSARAREEARTSAYANAENIKLARPKTGLYLLLGTVALFAALAFVIVKFG